MTKDLKKSSTNSGAIVDTKSSSIGIGSLSQSSSISSDKLDKSDKSNSATGIKGHNPASSKDDRKDI